MISAGRCALILLPTLLLLRAPASRADPLDDIRHRGALACAISKDVDDYSQFDLHGDLSALSADLCQAVSAAIFPGAARPVTIVATGDEISAVRDVHDGHADIAFGTTPDPALGAQLGVAFAPPILIDGQSFLVDRHDRIADVAGLSGRRVCVIEGTPEAELLRTRMAELGVAYVPFPFSERGEMMGALATGHCDAVTGDLSELANQRLALPALEADQVLPHPITVDPWSPVLRGDAGRLMAIVAAVEYGLVSAADLGIRRADATTRAAHPGDPAVGRLLGSGGWQARGIGVDERFLLRAIEAVGNYDELYRRDVGDRSPLRLPVGANVSITRGGALPSIPIGGPR